MQNELISRLIELHGEDGLAPTRADWQAILDIDGPLRILNLLKFAPNVEVDGKQISGADAYADYAAGVGPVFARIGGERLFFGAVAHLFGLGEMPDWDAAILTRYPSAEALANMWLAADYVQAHKSRRSGLERSQVLVFAGAD